MLPNTTYYSDGNDEYPEEEAAYVLGRFFKTLMTQTNQRFIETWKT